MPATILVGLSIEPPAKLLTLNAERRLHHMTRATIVSQWRYAGKLAALQEHLPTFSSARLEWTIYHARGRLADTVSHLPVFKAILDGLVDAGVFKDDDGTVILEQRFHAPMRGPNMVTLVIEGERE